MTKIWREWSATELGRAIERREIDPIELTSFFLSEIQKHSCADTIYARITEERAMAEANASSERARQGLRLSPLDGVPISWKDLFDTAAIATEAGTALLKGRMPSTDAEVVRRATSLGLICLGKTHLSEFAYAGLGVNPITGTPPCINDADAAPGGSSSGAAASVAFGLAPAAIGSDTGGSVRIPSAWNDLVGFKPTTHLISVKGVVPLCASFDTVGPLTRSVEDAAALFAVLMGNPKPPNSKATSLEFLRLVILEEGLEDASPDSLLGFQNALRKLRDEGATVESRSFPSVAKALPLSGCLYGVEAYGQWEELIESAPDSMYVEILDRFRLGKIYSGFEFFQAWNTLKQLRREFSKAVSGYDAVLLPTSPILPPKRETLLADREYYSQQNLMALRNTRIANLMNLPALTLPTGVPSAGLMLLGKPNADIGLLRTGRAAEQAIAKPAVDDFGPDRL